MDPADVDLVTHGQLEVEGRLLDASNATLYCSLTLDGRTANAVYKPIAGERPLWDFPDGTLAGREVATYEIATASGLGRVPPTVLRDGPLGEGMVQLWIDSGPTELVDVVAPSDVPEGWHVVLHAHDRYGAPVVLAHSARHDVAELALLDVVVNNTDRKGGHVLLGEDDRVYGVDHGICLHADPKLRTVLWGWAGKPVPPESARKVEGLLDALGGDLGETLARHLTDAEIDALRARARDLLDTGAFPAPHDTIRAIPWPLF